MNKTDRCAERLQSVADEFFAGGYEAAAILKALTDVSCAIAYKDGEDGASSLKTMAAVLLTSAEIQRSKLLAERMSSLISEQNGYRD